jgi:Tol biopolymer transport system component
LYKSWGFLSDLRFSPSGDALAFFEHPYRADDAGVLKMIDLAGRVTTLGPLWASAGGVAWAPSGKEVYFTATPQGAARTLHAASRQGVVRAVAKVPGALLLHDISRDGKLLISRENKNLVMEGTEDNSKPRDLSWFDWSNVVAASSDGDLILFDESGEGGGPQYSTYLHRASTGETMRLGPGRAMAIAPDGKSAITMLNSNHYMLQIVPVGPGQTRTVDGQGIEYQAVQYLPDGQRIVFIGQERDKPLRFYIQSVSGGPPKPLPVDVQPHWITVSPDGKTIAGRSREGKLVIQPITGGPVKTVASSGPIQPIRWTTDPNEIFAFCAGAGVPNQISKVNLTTGECTLFQDLTPSEADPDTKVSRVVMSSDGKRIVYSYHRTASELYIVAGW